MDPNSWRRDAEGLVEALTLLCKDAGRVRKMIALLAEDASSSRQAAWDKHGGPLFKQVVSRRPSMDQEARRLATRLRSVLFSGAAAEAPARLRALL